MKTTVSRFGRAALFCLFSLAACPSFAGVYDDLIAAVYRDDTATVIDLLKRGLDVNSVDPAGNTLLHVAARNGNLVLIDTLLANRANVMARNRVGDTALMLAAYNGKLEAAEKLIAGGADLNPKGWTPLHYAVFASQAEMVKLLLDKKPVVDARAPNEQTALMLAARMGLKPIADMLIAAKADITLKDQHGDTAMNIAQKANNTEIAAMLEKLMAALPKPEEAAKPAEAPKAAAEAPAGS